MIKLKQAVIVEGKYDKIKLASIIDAIIIQTDGFSIYKDKEKLDLIRTLAEKTGILILTDSDCAGFQIRSYLKGAVPNGTIFNAYIPDIFGKEKRKTAPSKEGKLGVEGVPKEVILAALQKAGITAELQDTKREVITKLDFYNDGLTGGENSSTLRRKLLQMLKLPERLTANSLIDVLNATISPQQYHELVSELNSTPLSQSIKEGRE